MMPTGWGFVLITVFAVAEIAWPTWVALLAAQVLTLFTGLHAFRWLPLMLFGLGYAACVARLLWRGGWRPF